MKAWGGNNLSLFLGFWLLIGMFTNGHNGESDTIAWFAEAIGFGHNHFPAIALFSVLASIETMLMACKKAPPYFESKTLGTSMLAFLSTEALIRSGAGMGDEKLWLVVFPGMLFFIVATFLVTQFVIFALYQLSRISLTGNFSRDK